LLSAGALTPLNKVSEEERQQREDAALPPKLRPINSGSLLAKTVLKAVLATPAAERAAEKTAPFQLSMGASRGAEKLIHVCRAAYENKWLVGKNDFANGFNSMSRQKMLDSHCLLFPEGTTSLIFSMVLILLSFCLMLITTLLRCRVLKVHGRAVQQAHMAFVWAYIP
jgi:hypothetical protein